jgi:hypothetical protein
MQNILDFRSYVYPDTALGSTWYGISEVSMTLCDVNGIPHEERLECIYTRGLATELARWIFSRFDLFPSPNNDKSGNRLDPWQDFYWPYLAHFLQAIKKYKKRYPRAAPSRGSSLLLIQSQIDRCIGSRPELEKALDDLDVKAITSIAPPFLIHPAIRRDPLPFLRESLSISFCSRLTGTCLGEPLGDVTSSGFRTGDKLYVAAYKEALTYRSQGRRSDEDTN